MSSGLPSDVIANHSVEDGEELAHHSGERELFGFSGGEQALIEALENGVAAAGNQSSHVEGTAHLGSSAPSRALAAHFFAIAVERGNADQSRDLLAVKPSELGQIGDQRARNDVADPGHRA